MIWPPRRSSIPVGILEVQSGQLELTFGSSHKTSDLVADCLENWWQRRSQELGGVEELLPHLDNRPESRGRRTQFLARLVSFARCERPAYPAGLPSALSQQV